MAILALDKSYVSLFKLLYHEPRPYMIEPNIKPISCSKAFGNPSGHSSASQIFTICLFLDFFHGVEKVITFHSKKVYNFCLFLCIFWAVSIPYSRFILGVHSLDQIVFGVSIGIWAGFTLHFLVRDHFIKHVESLIRKS